MWHRIFGGVFGVWMGAATIPAIQSMLRQHGWMFWMDLGMVAFFASVSILCLLMAIGKNPPSKKPD
jgi:hypothetical protein